MSLALPLALLVGLLVGGPIVAHFVRRSRSPERPLPTFRLLERALRDSQKRRRVDDRALFALRILAVAFAALAAAAPFVRVPLELGDGRACALAVVVDASRSMLARSGTRPLIEIARERAARAALELPEGSEITVVLATDPPRVLVDRSTLPEAAARSIRSVESGVAVGGDRLQAATRLALRRIHGSSFALRRLIVYSDFDAHVDISGIEPPRGVTADFVRLEPSSRANATVVVDSVRVDPEHPETRVVRAGVLAHGIEAETSLELSVEGTTNAVRTTAGSPATLVELHSPRLRETTPTAVLRADVEDVLPEDDELDLILRTEPATRLLLVDGEPATNRYDDEVGLAARALELVPASEHRFEVQRIDAGALGAEELRRSDVVVLANVDRLSADVVDVLVERVRAGLGLFVAPGDRTDGRTVSSQLSALLPARIGLHAPCPDARGGMPRDVPAGIVVSGFAGMAHRRCTELEPNLGRSRTAMVRDDGAPLLVVGEFGRGRVAVLGTSLDPEDSDLSLRPGFLPLLASTARYLDSSGSSIDDRVPPGTTVRVGRDGVRVVDPDGRELLPDAEGRLGPLDRLGPYRVERDGRPDPDASFTVVAELAESDLRAGPLPSSAAGRGGRANAGTASLRRDLSAPVFAVLGLLVLTEGFLRERQRGRRVASTTRSMAP